ncbi:innexin unc-9-like isoform X3 [Symsagittifera roscoffensis]
MFPLRLVSGISQITGTGDGDFVDRLNHRYTPIVLIVFAILTTTKQYVGEPIQCWAPNHFSHAWIEYTNHICWVSNTYFLPLNTPYIRQDTPEKQGSYVTYYQWVPLALAAMSLLFYMPRKLWRTAGKRSGLDIDNIVVTATTFENAVSSEVRDKTIEHIAKHLDRYLGSQREYRRGCWPKCKQMVCVTCNRRNGTYLGLFYLFSKFIYIFNGIVQLVALNEFLGDRYSLYGLAALLDFINGVTWQTSRRFPRITMCDFSIRVMGHNVHDYTVQCVLPVNLFNEMIFFFVWWWLVIITICTCINFVEWAFKLIFAVDRILYIKKHLKFMDRYDRSEHRKLLAMFVNHYLKPDGVFIIRLLAKNTNTLMTSELVAKLWDNYKEKHTERLPELTKTSLNPSAESTCSRKHMNHLHHTTNMQPFHLEVRCRNPNDTNWYEPRFKPEAPPNIPPPMFLAGSPESMIKGPEIQQS